jgi:hypothetical protein
MDIATLVVAILAIIISGLALRHSSASADASRRSAKAAEEALALQQEAAKPQVDLRIFCPGRGTYLLKNFGQADAVGIALVEEDQEHVDWLDPLGEVLHAGDSREIMPLTGADPVRRLRFTWDGQDVPVYVSLP